MICLETIAIRRNQMIDYFLQESKKAIDIKTKIETTDQEIDKMIYALYELTEKEMEVVKG